MIKRKAGLSIGLVTEERLERCAAAGLDVVEFSAVADDSQWELIPCWVEKTGVDVRSFHLPFTHENVMTKNPDEWQKVLDLYLKLFDGCAKAGAKIMVAHPGNAIPPDGERESYMQTSIEHMTLLTEECKKRGLIFAVENMPNGLCRTAAEAARMLVAIPDLKFCFDSNHLLRNTHEDFIKTVAHRIVTTHISDFDFVTEKHWFPLQGQINWRKVIEVFDAVGYAGPFVYETMPMGHTWEDVRPNFEYLCSLMKVK